MTRKTRWEKPVATGPSKRLREPDSGSDSGPVRVKRESESDAGPRVKRVARPIPANPDKDRLENWFPDDHLDSGVDTPLKGKGNSQAKAKATEPPVAPPMRDCCLACSKQQSTSPGLACTPHPNTNKCTRCHNLRKSCVRQFPERFQTRLNRPLTLSDRVAALGPPATLRGAILDSYRADSDALCAVQRGWTRQIQRHRAERRVRERACYDSGRAIVEVGLLAVGALTRIADTLDGIHDVLRYSNRLAAIVADPEDTDEGDDDGGNDGDDDGDDGGDGGDGR